ncbi:MAG TPA: ferric reductase-like transmembrane domain-containing protein [Acidimicrobiales bacterium]|nr:ferric reductase-like transmembrane domain-containing protein [Acidimicrobiales bacterium]
MSSRLIWYMARSSGIVTWALLAASVIWGLALTTRAFGRRPRPAWILDLHRFLGGLALVFLSIHMTAISLDTYVHFGLVSLLVPLTGSWHPVAVAWGIVAMYLMVAVEVTSLLRTRLSPQLWRAAHYAAFPLLALGTIHALTAGTDRHTVVLRYGMLAVLAVAIILAAVRVAKSEYHDVMTAPVRTPDRRPHHRRVNASRSATR